MNFGDVETVAMSIALDDALTYGQKVSQLDKISKKLDEDSQIPMGDIYSLLDDGLECVDIDN
ncbi:hypothetical protein ACPV5Q_15375 [Vibrio astriarenae]